MQRQAHHPHAGCEDVFKTPLSFTIPSFLMGAAMSFDIGGSIRGRLYRCISENAYEADRVALLGDFVVIGDNMIDAMEAFESTHAREPEPANEQQERGRETAEV